MVTANSLVVTARNRVIREEPMVDFHSGPAAPAESSGRAVNADAVGTTLACRGGLQRTLARRDVELKGLEPLQNAC